MIEAYISHLRELLGDIIHDTMNQIRKKQTRTWDELQAESYEVKESIDLEDEDEEAPYNPKNLPLGWDGK